MIRYFVAVFLLLSTLALSLHAQTTVVEQDSVYVETSQDTTILIKSYASRYDPRKAILYAAVLPGLGQIYNKKYWKLPLVYGGFFALGYSVTFYQNLYTKYKGQLFYNLENNTDENPESGATTESLRTFVDKSRRQRDFWIIMIGAMYLLQMVDAHVDSHLKEFDLNPQLQVSIQPYTEQSMMTGRQNGLSLVIKF